MCPLCESRASPPALGSTATETGPRSAPESEHCRAAAWDPACSDGHLQWCGNPYRGHRDLTRAGNRRHPFNGYMFHNHTAKPTQFFSTNTMMYGTQSGIVISVASVGESTSKAPSFLPQHAKKISHAIIMRCYESKFTQDTHPWSKLAPTNLIMSRKGRLAAHG